MGKLRTAMLLILATVTALLAVSGGVAVAKLSYTKHDEDGLEGKSGDGKAKISGHIRWYEAEGKPTRRGDYAPRSKVRAIKSVGCIWVKVSYGFPQASGSFEVGSGGAGAGGSVSGGTYVASNGYYRSCRRPGHKRPKRLSLYGVGYARGYLNSSTVEICTSSRKKNGPRFCSFEKNYYGYDPNDGTD